MSLNSPTVLARSFETPAVFQSRRANFGLESLARFLPDRGFWTANEEALTVDGERSTPQSGTLVRLLRYARSGDTYSPAEQCAYLTEPMHGGDISGGRSGLVALVELPDGRLLALERSLALRFPDFFESRLYELDFSGATDVSGFDGLIDADFVLVHKQLLWAGSVSNMEGLTFGPELANGRTALLGIVDDGDPLSSTRVVAFELIGDTGVPPAPRVTELPGSGMEQAEVDRRPPP